MTQCCVFGCNNDGGHKFPNDKALRCQWVHAVRRKNWKPVKTSVICQAHFLPSDYMSEGYYSGVTNTRKRIKKNAIPTRNLFLSNRPISNIPGALERSSRYERRHSKKDVKVVSPPMTTELEVGLGGPPTNIETFIGLEVECISNNSHNPSNLELQTLSDMNRPQCEVGTQTAPISMFCVSKFNKNDKVIKFYTGLESYEKFRLVLQSLGPAAHHLHYRWSQNLILSVENQFFLTLIKLRRNKHDFEVALLFDVSQTTVSNIFVTWINFMACQWAELNIWPSKELVQYYLPSGFRETFPSTRVLIDGTEFPINKPSKPSVQTATFSTYKNRNTLKVLVGCTPGGLISYCSPAYGGATSDRQIVERSKLTSMCDRGDSIMADRGFNVQDIFSTNDIAINIPSFLKGKSQLPGLTVVNDRKIASKRVHIERIIGLTKTYEILNGPLNHYYVPLGSRIFSVCIMLCNFRDVIIGKNA